MEETLIDTNVILDVLLKRSPYSEDAYSILKLADEKKIYIRIIRFNVAISLIKRYN